MNRMIKSLLTVAILLLVCTSCSSTSDSGTSEAGSATLLLSAAASLSEVMDQVIPSFHKEHSNIKIEVNYASSGTLQRQIEQGAPADLFISAGEKQITALVEQELVTQVVPLLSNELVVVGGSTLQLTTDTLEQLLQETNPSFIAMGEPDTVPAGQYARQALDREHLWSVWKEYVVFGKDVRQVLAYVEQGNADLGFVYKTDAMSSNQVNIIHTVDEALYDPIIYPLAVVSTTKAPEAAQLFYDYLQQEQAIAIYKQYGFTVAQ